MTEISGVPAYNPDDTDPANALRLQAFLARIGAERVRDSFTDPAHLAERVSFAAAIG